MAAKQDLEGDHLGKASLMPLLYNAQYWRDRAEEARVIASTMVTSGGPRVMLEVAENYDRMARLAERMHASDLTAHSTRGSGSE
ncbi:MAG TPA: hypothetical protein VMB73_06295 [Acetobacteraceae bacterium]|nr:hypothetical protein [Acetobacteraceae bacterium]